MESVFNKKSIEGKIFIIVHAGNKNWLIDGAILIFWTKNKSLDYHEHEFRIVRKMAQRKALAFTW